MENNIENTISSYISNHWSGFSSPCRVWQEEQRCSLSYVIGFIPKKTWKDVSGGATPGWKTQTQTEIALPNFFIYGFWSEAQDQFKSFQIPAMWFHPVSPLIFSLTHTHKAPYDGLLEIDARTGFQKVHTSGPLWEGDLRTVPGAGFGNTVTYRLSLLGSSMATITIGMCIYIMRSDRSWLADSVVLYFICNSIPQEQWGPPQVALPESRIRMPFFRQISAIRNIFL